MKLSETLEKCKECTRCPLHQTKTNTVFGVGNEDAALMFIGEAPGEKEDESGVPFVGPAGKLFDKYLEYVGIDRNEVYIANILKCRPPRNRDPLPEEEDACIVYLREQVRAIRPKIIVCLGRVAAKRLISPDFRITAQHGKWFDAAGFKMCAVYHPSALLRDTSKKADMLKDMKMIKEVYDSLK
ncbi:MAG: uracil-DNA glycosylase [Clostridia bacterium]|nr:uracil-DNA glycosylase [Clostridia bacterium]